MDNLSVLRLFKGYEGVDNGQYSEDALQYGLLIPKDAPVDVSVEAIKLYGKDGEKWNQTFHKSWAKVAESPIEVLIAEQLLHYFTTYGFEDLGIFDHDLVYIPHEKLEVPELDKDIELVVIHAYTKEQIAEKVMTLLTSGIALSEKTIEDLKNLSDLVDKERFDEVSNREFRLYLYDKYNVVPKDPEVFLRYLLYKITGNTLKIKSTSYLYMVSICAERDDKMVELLLKRYLNNDEKWNKLSSVFLRNKKFFVALKQTNNKYIKTTVNKLRKLAKKNHKPLANNLLDSLTNPLVTIEDDKLLKLLDSIEIFREMRIVDGLAYRLENYKDIVYNIRNGRSFATDRKVLSERELSLINDRYNLVYNHLLGRVYDNLKGKYVYLPNNIIYTLPTSEKRFVSMFPCGSYIDLPRGDNLIVGIHWSNIKTKHGDDRVDLDFHLLGENATYGWNTSYRNGPDILFSGDVTDAPKGASELYYIDRSICENFLLSINNYTSNSEEVPFELVIARATESMRDKIKAGIRDNYVFDPNDILCKVNLFVEPYASQMNIGSVNITKEGIRVIFENTASGRGIVSRNDEIAEIRRAYASQFNNSRVKLNDLLRDAGVKLSKSDTIMKKTTTYVFKSEEDKEKFIEDNPDYKLHLEEVNLVVDSSTADFRTKVITKSEPVPVDFDLSLDKIAKDSIIKLFSN